MSLQISAIDLINVVFLAVGVGICGLILLQISQSPSMDRKQKLLFQAFFWSLAVTVATQLDVQALIGQPGDSIHVLLEIFQFICLTVGGFVTFIFSIIVIDSARADARVKRYRSLLYLLIGMHVLLMVYAWLSDSIYYFDADNAYHRTSLYFLSNLGLFCMLMFDAYLLIRYRDSFHRRLRTAFWLYIFAPIFAIVIQTLYFGLQYILFSTIIAAVYVSLVLFRVQNEQFEAQRMEASRIETELNMAASIQTSMLPSTFPAFPDRSEFDIFASMAPAKEVGGDFYDFFMAGDDRLCLLIADVSGKGVPAALFMMTAKTMLKDACRSHASPAAALRHVNALICENNPENMFVTVWLGFLEISTGKLTWADAGHDPLMLYRNGTWELLPKGGGIALGLLEPELLDPDPFADDNLYLKPGDALFQYTDGVTEAMTADLEQFGVKRLLAALGSAPGADPEALLPHVRAQLDAFVQGAPQFDDITMLALRYRGADEAQA